MSTLYGHCPHCGAEVESRERGINGNDIYAAGHRYPSAFTLSRLASEWVQMVRLTLHHCRENLLLLAAGETPNAALGTLATRCKRMLNAIPLKPQEGPTT